MRQMVAATLVTLCLAAGSVASAAEVTFVLTNGERHTGQLFYDTGTSVSLINNGQKRAFPVREIAVMLYAPGDPSRDELNQLPTSGNPPELERHMLVMKDGRVMKGKVYHWNADSVQFDTTSGRGTYPANDIARLYLNGVPARNVFNSILNSGQAVATGGSSTASGPSQAKVRVEGNRAWTDTGLVVRAGEQVQFNADGTVTFGANMTAGPDGNKDLPPNANYPVRAMSVGGLIGRVGNGQPFPIGSTRQPIQMPNNGRLFLGVNDDQHGDNSDGFNVEIFRK